MITVFLLFLIFASIHSITASGKFKKACTERFGVVFMRVYYRALYTLISVVTAAVVLFFVRHASGQEVWTAPPVVKWAMHGIQLAALVFGARSFEHLDAGEFLGFKQVWRYFVRREVTGDSEGLHERGLVTTGVYGTVRHPMYLAGLVIVTFNPVLTVNGLAFSLLAGLYFVFGAVIEERRFSDKFGDQYREYMKRVPMLIPRMLFFRKGRRG